MIPHEMTRRRQREPQGVAILVVIPILLFVSVVGLFMLYIVQAKLESTTIVVQAKQAKYLAYSASQLALLEIQERTQLASNARSESLTINVLAPDTLPANGTIFVPDHSPRMLFQFTRSGAILTLDTPIRSNLPKGASLYLCRDLDGDGQFGSIETVAFGTGVMRASRAASGTEPDNESVGGDGGRNNPPGGAAQGYPQGRGGEQGRGHGWHGGPPGWQQPGGGDGTNPERATGNPGPPALYVRGVGRVGPAESVHEVAVILY